MSREPYVIVYRTPDALETWVRLVCGGLLGLIVAVCVCVKLRPLGTVTVATPPDCPPHELGDTAQTRACDLPGPILWLSRFDRLDRQGRVDEN
jgi:hypothetical protein